ncbi:mitochondrial potassium channel [Octopus sinensis]|uniref:Mitochondrial potassium channel n=1 Tax=Octopus sinensis TaxID=2607531 RepID=A0A6P7SEG1_9MOLL|nr:mitochondrial potassium channel [Octopus sinensis]
MAVQCICRYPGIFLISARPLLNFTRTFLHKRQLTNMNLSKLSKISLTNGKAGKLMQTYEEFIGLSDVKAAQSKVIESEKNFLKIQEQRRQKSHELFEIQMNLRKINAELEKINRADDKYLALLTQEHAIIQREANLNNDLSDLEKLEKEHFTALSISVRESHEKERAQSEKTKYWSVIGSIIGALLGIIGTTINNKMRMNELRSIVTKSTEEGQQQRALTEKVITALKKQLASTETFISELHGLLKSNVLTPATLSNIGEQFIHYNKEHAKDSSAAFLTGSSQKLEQQTAELLTCLKHQDKFLTIELSAIKELLQKTHMDVNKDGIIYINPDIDHHLEDNNRKLEQRLKLHSLATVTFIYAAFALTLPVLYSIFRGN